MKIRDGRHLALTALGSAAVGAGIVGYSIKRHLLPQTTPIDFPLSKAIGEAALSVQDDGSWSVNLTVIPTCLDGSPDASATMPAAPMVCDLSPAVALMHSAILRAARAGDHKVLEELAFGVSEEFTYSFEEPVLRGRPASYWQKLEGEGQDVLGALVEVLELPYARLEHMYIWPADLDWLDPSQNPGSQTPSAEKASPAPTKQRAKSGYRAGIATTGDWLFFVADD